MRRCTAGPRLRAVPTISGADARRFRLTSDLLAVLGLGGIGCFVLAVVALHLLPTGLDPIRCTVSEYVNEPYGWLIPAGGLGLAFGSAAVTLALVPTLKRSGRTAAGRLPAATA